MSPAGRRRWVTRVAPIRLEGAVRVACCALGLASSVTAVGGCGTNETSSVPARTPVTSAPMFFEFNSPDGQSLVAERLRGRVTVIVLIASYDFASQLMARQVAELRHDFTPRINAGAVVMEQPAYAELKETFQQTLNLDYPVVMADHATLNGRGPFGEVERIPTTIVLDPTGTERARLYGAVTRNVLEAALRDARQ